MSRQFPAITGILLSSSLPVIGAELLQ